MTEPESSVSINLTSSGSTSAMPLPHEPEGILQDDLEAIHKMTDQQRGRLLAIACRSAARLDRSRQQAGLPAPVGEPWPISTWEFLRTHTRQYVAT